MLTSKRLLDLMNLVEAEVPVDAWTVGDVHVWPLVRYQIYVPNLYVHRRVTESKPPTLAHELLRKLRLLTVEETLRGNLLGAKARIEDRAHEDTLRGPRDVFLIGDGVSVARLDGEVFDRCCDPVASRLRARGLSTLMSSWGHVYPTPRHSPSVFVQPHLDLARAKARLLRRFDAPRTSLPGWDEAMQILASAESSLWLPTRATIEIEGHYAHRFARFWEKTLRRLSTKAVFVVSYMGTDGMALALAARRLGISCCDVQHGMISGVHWAYAGWNRLPPGGYGLVPSHFAVWSDDDAATINRWGGEAHRGVVTGNLFLEDWMSGALPGTKEPLDRVRAVTRGRPEKIRVLYTANGLETADVVSRIVDLVQAMDGEAFFHMRMHPVRPEARERFLAVLATRPNQNWEIDVSTREPMYSVMTSCDVHVTEVSSASYECRAVGIPTVLLSPAEEDAFQDLVAAGDAVVAPPGDEARRAILTFAAAGRRARGAGVARGPDALFASMGLG